MFCFVHAADLHLDTPFEGIGHVAPEIAQALRDASLRAWDGLVQLALDQGAAFLVLAGDIYDGPERGVRAQLHFLQGLEKLSSAGIQVFIAHGNHDPLDGWSAITKWPRGVTVFGSEGVTAVPVERDGRLLAVVYGISYARREIEENLAIRFQAGRGGSLPEVGRRGVLSATGRGGVLSVTGRGGAPSQVSHVGALSTMGPEKALSEMDRERSRLEMDHERALHVGVLHCNVGSNSAHRPYAPCTVRDLAASGMDYWALGHIHQRQQLQEGDAWIVYPGNTQGLSLKESEAGPKGAVVVQAEGKRVVGVRFFPLDEVRFGSVRVDISHAGSLPELAEVFISEARRLMSGYSGRALILRAMAVGRGHLHHGLMRHGAVKGLLEELRDRSRNMSPIVWWDSLLVRTSAGIDREVIRLRGDFQADLVGLVDQLLSDPVALERFFETHAASLEDSIPALARLVEPLDEGQRRELLVQAERLALDMLQEGDQGL